jgi:hypothetical protein
LGGLLAWDDSQDEKETWTPVTKLGRLVKDRKIKTLEEIYLFSLPVKGKATAVNC